MQIYHFFQHPSQPDICVQQDAREAGAEFIWVDCTREDVVNRSFIARFGPMLKKGGFLSG